MRLMAPAIPMHRVLGSALVLACALLLGACGFTLRGTADLPTDLRTLHLESLDARSDIVRQMRRSLVNSGIEVLDQPEPGVYSLGLGREQVTERVLSVNSNARAGEYEMTMSIPFQLRLGPEILIAPETLVLEQVYVADPENAVAKSEEAEQLREEMRLELVSQILRRLQGYFDGPVEPAT